MFYTMFVMRMKCFFTIFFIALFTPILAQSPRGLSLSTVLEDTLTRQGHDVTKETISDTSQDEYPYNLLVHFPAAPKSHTEAPHRPPVGRRISSDNIRDRIVFSITQEDAEAHLDAVLAFLEKLKKEPPAANTIFLLSAQERSSVRAPLAFTGTEVFARTFEDSERSAAVILRFDGRKKDEIHIGNRQRTSPLWLTRQLVEAYDATDRDFDYKDKLASLYRLGMLNSSRRMNAFILNNIPAIDINFAEEPDFEPLHYFATHYSSRHSQLWDSHYLFVSLFGKLLWFGETFFFITTLILGTALLIILCTSTFRGKNGEDYKKDFARTWFFIPITIAVTFLSLWLGQKFCRSFPLLARTSPIMQLGIKFIFALIFNAILFGLQDYFRVNSVQFTHGYFIYLVGISNVFIFSAVDLIFSLTFLVEYIFIYIARKATRIIPLMLSALMMFSPATPYIYQCIRYGQRNNLYLMVFSSPQLNLLFALLMFPLLIMWDRIIERLQSSMVANKFSVKRILFNQTLSLGIIMGILLVAIITLSSISNHIIKSNASPVVETINENQNTFTISASKTKFLDMTTQHITIKSKIDALKYEAVISSDTGLPLYDSSYDYTVNEEIKTAFFTIPDYPPRTVTIDYAADGKIPARLFVTAWYPTDKENTFRKETRGLLVAGEY